MMDQKQEALRLDRWATAIRSPRFLGLLGFGIVLAVLAITWVLPPFLDQIEARTGFRMYDPLLANMGPYDLSKLVFVATYSAALLGILRNIGKPDQVIWILYAYTAINLFRMVTMTLVPLEPAATIIPLRDPFLEGGVYAGAPKIKDLFFSGHTATVSMFIFMERDPKWRKVFILCPILVAIPILLQHVHYTIDVLAAPVFAFLCVWAVREGLRRLLPNFQAGQVH